MSNFKTITAIYNDKNEARGAIAYLRSHGISGASISLLGSENTVDKSMEFESEESVAEKGAQGVAVGAAVGASVIGLTTFTAATLTGGAALLGAGPLISAVAGATAGATAGGLVGGFVGVGIPEVEARHIEEKLNEGYVVIGVESKNDQADYVKNLMENTKGERVVVH